MSKPGIVGGTLLVLRKDLLIEWRTRARMSALIFFALATLFIFSFALSADTAILRKNAAGYLWLAILFASVLSLGESFRIESENLCLDGLRLVPTDPRAIFLGKALGNTFLLWLLALVITPITIALYDIRFEPVQLDAAAQAVTSSSGFPWWPLLQLAGFLLLGSLAIAAPGTVYAAIASNIRARDVILPLLLFPMLIPGLLASVKGTALILEGDPMHQLGSWLGLLTAFNLLYWSLCFALFPRVVEDD